LFEVIAAELADVVATPAVESLLVISILAGVPLSKLEAAFPQLPVIRAMPYLRQRWGRNFLRFSYPESHQNTAQKLFSAVGEVVRETLMDAVTGLRSGPAYVAIMVEALSDGGVAGGYRAIATQMALQTVRGDGSDVARNRNTQPN